MAGAGGIIFADPDGACPCGSNEQAKQCCLDNRGRIRGVPRPVRISPPSGAFEHTECYASPLGGCSRKLTREHYSAPLSFLGAAERAGGKIGMGKVPWAPDGGTVPTSAVNLGAKVLCKHHNEALSPLDDVGARFLTSLLMISRRPADEVREHRALFNGEDLERWLLKVLCGTAAMESRHRNETWRPPAAWLRCLYKLDGEATLSGMKMWVQAGTVMAYDPTATTWSTTPIDDPEGGDPWGLRFHFCDLEFTLQLDPRVRGRWIWNGRARPGILAFLTGTPLEMWLGFSYRNCQPGVILYGRFPTT